jgi:tetratricopeptide (TPR) repeat protein
MTDDLYERYKEALRVGHVAVLRGALEEALAAYRTAASIAPSRALPHTSLGGVMLRLGHLEDALVEYAAAVARAPHDEGALLGQAEALNLAGQRVDAAQALDHVSEIQEAAGRLPEAADTLRRALELDDTPERSRRQRGLLREIRLSAGDQAAEQLLARALRLRDEPSGDEAEAARLRTEAKPSRAAEAARAFEPAASPAAEPVGTVMAEASPSAKIVAPVGAEPGLSPVVEPVATAAAEPMLEMPEVAELVAAVSASGPDLAASIEPILAAVGVMDGAFDMEAPLGPVGESQHQPTGDELLAAAEAADQAGDLTALRSLLLWTARAYAREGRFEAGLDATHRLLQRAPGDVDAHLVLVELYVARDWNGLAAEKLALLGRLAELNDDEATRQRVCKVSSRVFPNDERLGALCA